MHMYTVFESVLYKLCSWWGSLVWRIFWRARSSTECVWR